MIKNLFSKIFRIKPIMIGLGIAILLEIAERSIDYIFGQGDGNLDQFYLSKIITSIQYIAIGLFMIWLIILGVRAEIINRYSVIITLIMIPIVIEVYGRMLPEEKINKKLAFQINKLEKAHYFDQYIQDRKIAPKNLTYFDYHLYAASKYKSKTFRFTKYFNSRNIPDALPIDKADNLVWFFGGSTMQNMETIDSLTIANQVVKNLNEKGYKSSGKNFGVGSFQTCLESIKFQDILRRVPEDERPNYVVFYDGYNDSGHTYHFGAGNMQTDKSNKLNALISGDYSTIFWYSFSKKLSKYSHYWRKVQAPRFEFDLFFNDKFRQYSYLADSTNLNKGLNIYEDNTRMIRAICKEFNIQPIFILQPIMATKKNHTEFEREALKQLDSVQVQFMKDFYIEAKNRMSKYDDFYDLSWIFNNSKRNDFYDYGHTGPYSSITTGKYISEILLQYIEKEK